MNIQKNIFMSVLLCLSICSTDSVVMHRVNFGNVTTESYQDIINTFKNNMYWIQSGLMSDI